MLNFDENYYLHEEANATLFRNVMQAISTWFTGQVFSPKSHVIAVEPSSIKFIPIVEIILKNILFAKDASIPALTNSDLSLKHYKSLQTKCQNLLKKHSLPDKQIFITDILKACKLLQMRTSYASIDVINTLGPYVTFQNFQIIREFHYIQQFVDLFWSSCLWQYPTDLIPYSPKWHILEKYYYLVKITFAFIFFLQ